MNLLSPLLDLHRDIVCLFFLLNFFDVLDFIQIKKLVELGQDQLIALWKDQEVRFHFV